MSKISALMLGQHKEMRRALLREPDRKCRVCGKPITYGINGSQMFDTCLECYQPSYPCKPTTKRNSVDWDELDALEDRCLGDDVD